MTMIPPTMIVMTSPKKRDMASIESRKVRNVRYRTERTLLMAIVIEPEHEQMVDSLRSGHEGEVPSHVAVRRMFSHVSLEGE